MTSCARASATAGTATSSSCCGFTTRSSCCCRPEIAEQVGEILVRHAKEPGEFYGFRVPLDAEYKVGRSWAGDVVVSPRPFSAPSPQNDAVIVDEHDERARNSSTISTPAPWEDDAAPAPSIAPTPARMIPLPELIGEPLVDGKICCPFHDDSTPSCHIYR